MTALALWLEGPGGTILLAALMLALAVLARAEGVRRGRVLERRAAAEREAEQRADAWLRQMRAAEGIEAVKRAAIPAWDIHQRAQRARRTSTAAFLNPRPSLEIELPDDDPFLEPPRWSAPDVSDWTKGMAAQLDTALAELRENTDQWMIDHGIREPS